MGLKSFDPSSFSLGGDAFGLTRLDYAVDQIKRHGVNWARKHSLWPMPFATACCGIELMAVAASRYDISRFGAEAMRFSPRQCDLLIVAGRVVMKMMPVLQKIYLQMTEPKWVISMGACASSGGVFDTYAVVQGIDQFVPVDVYLPGCPPRPETILEGFMAIQRIVTEHGIVPSAERKGLGLVVTAPPKTNVALGPGLAASIGNN
ncbi:MAG: NADH-quinone oxidoreductase subunit NuoB [Phycisphaerae bacterium]|nr:NADH-quinone oxidoreductase subunit NuoB [Phycisphaerae bacterium]